MSKDKKAAKGREPSNRLVGQAEHFLVREPLAQKNITLKHAVDGNISEMCKRLANGLQTRRIGGLSHLRKWNLGHYPATDRARTAAQAALAAFRRHASEAKWAQISRLSSPSLDDLFKGLIADPTTWLATENPHFGDRKPGDLIGTEEESKVYNLLRAVDLGMF